MTDDAPALPRDDSNAWTQVLPAEALSFVRSRRHQLQTAVCQAPIVPVLLAASGYLLWLAREARHRQRSRQAKEEVRLQRDAAQVEAKRREFLQRRLEDLASQRVELDSKLQHGSQVSSRVNQLCNDFQQLQTQHEVSLQARDKERLAQRAAQAELAAAHTLLQAAELEAQTLRTQLATLQQTEAGHKGLQQKLLLARLSKQHLQTQTRQQQSALQDLQGEVQRQRNCLAERERQLAEVQRELAVLRHKASSTAGPAMQPRDLRVVLPASPDAKARYASENNSSPAAITPDAAKSLRSLDASRIPAPSPGASTTGSAGVLSPSNSRIPRPVRLG